MREKAELRECGQLGKLATFKSTDTMPRREKEMQVKGVIQKEKEGRKGRQVSRINSIDQ